MALWAVKCDPSPGVFTRGGAVLVHEDRAELEFLFPGRSTVDVTTSSLPKMRWRDHPDMAGIRWPLRREDFR
jgi:hypothetical protein